MEYFVKMAHEHGIVRGLEISEIGVDSLVFGNKNAAGNIHMLVVIKARHDLGECTGECK